MAAINYVDSKKMIKIEDKENKRSTTTSTTTTTKE